MGRNNKAAEVLLSHQGDGITSSVDLANYIKYGRSNWEKIMDLAAFLSQISIKKRYLTESQQIEACKKYISELIKRYCEDSNEQEILRLWKKVDDKIHQNPAYGFMVAQAIDNAIAETGYGEHLKGDISYRLIKGFLEKTREAQEEPKYDELTGISQWFEREDMTVTTLEYRSYADAVMDLLKGRRWRVLGVALTPARSSWSIKSYSDPSLSFIVPNSKKRLSIWNVYGFQGDTQVVGFAVGFNIYNMDFGIINLNDSVFTM